ncbi:hypothetical protein [Victivallis vadensis]|uniref:hypothetical protein n=1 Tax=Victivallis vadensis TaxID=172901 RepID=UPI0023F80DCC|nr:hypothetical protein [Victivallis vadensis]
MSDQEYELIGILKNGICPHTGKRYDCLRCDGVKSHEFTNQGTHIIHCGFAVENGLAGFNDPLPKWNKLATIFVGVHSGRELREYFLKLHLLGVKYLPISEECNDFCYKTGCRGHLKNLMEALR